MACPNAEAIVILCSHLCVGEGVQPLEPREWNQLARRLYGQELEPKQLLEFSRDDFSSKLNCGPEETERLMRLIGRSASLGFEISRYATIGVRIVTRADKEYPAQLKQKLKNACPPLFYYAGNLELLNKPCVGYVGSRAIEAQDLDFTVQAVRKTVERGYGVVSGGARGVDTAAETEALLQGGQVVSYLADSLMRRIRKREFLRAVQDGQAIVLSAVKPDADFQTRTAMARNRLIYCHSNGTVVVRSNLNTGGTWSGASDSLKHRWCPVFCWDQPEYPGNAALIEKGAIAIDAAWNGDVLAAPVQPETPGEIVGEQLNLFDSLKIDN